MTQGFFCSKIYMLREDAHSRQHLNSPKAIKLRYLEQQRLDQLKSDHPTDNDPDHNQHQQYPYQQQYQQQDKTKPIEVKDAESGINAMQPNELDTPRSPNKPVSSPVDTVGSKYQHYYHVQRKVLMKQWISGKVLWLLVLLLACMPSIIILTAPWIDPTALSKLKLILVHMTKSSYEHSHHSRFHLYPIASASNTNINISLHCRRVRWR